MIKTEKKLTEYLSILYNASYMPMHLIKGEDILASYPGWLLPLKYILQYKNYMEEIGISYHYITTDEALILGIVRDPSKDINVIVGPVSPIAISTKEIKSMIIKYALNIEDTEIIIEYFRRTPTFSLHQFLNIMVLIHKEMNGEIIHVIEKYQDMNSKIEKKISKEHSSALIERKENATYHNSYYFEQEYFGFLERGDVKGLNDFLQNVPYITEGNVASNSLRQAKNIFITSITLATRHAIVGGLDIETAYQLSDSYIQEVEKMSDISAITFMNMTAILDFTKRVADAKIPTGMSPEIFQCMQYISNYINQKLSVELIAKEMNMDRCTLSKKFKKELGFNISNYITRRKLEEAKSLLHYTDKTISEISEYLCFSTQSYFQNVFKKKYGMTPKEYRNQTNS